MVMKILILSAIFITLISCSSTKVGMQFINKSPRGFEAINIKKEQYSKAYQAAEKHCAKYAKVPRILKTIKQEQNEDDFIPMQTITFECLKPNR